ncbi:hypothetical protein CL616_00030 [archaeon]|nr:hypothetical protein [archaeon]|tara:strand:- start:406 stop:708 length:303 start_codon:yes stop_codon:yes gene_type:complete
MSVEKKVEGTNLEGLLSKLLSSVDKVVEKSSGVVQKSYGALKTIMLDYVARGVDSSVNVVKKYAYDKPMDLLQRDPELVTGVACAVPFLFIYYAPYVLFI